MQPAWAGAGLSAAEAARLLTETASSNPLQLGQVLYNLNDVTIVASTVAAGNVSPPSYARYAYSNGVPAEAGMPIAVTGGTIDQIQDVRATHIVASAKEMVFVLADGAITGLGARGTSSVGFEPVSTTWPIATAGMRFIIDSNPNVIADSQVLIVGTHADASCVWTFDVAGQTATLGGPYALKGLAGCTILGACLCRCQTDARLILFLRGADGLQVADFGSEILVSLAKGAAPDALPTMVPVTGCSATAAISCATGTLIAKTGTQQSNGNEQIAIVFPWCQADGAAYGYSVAVLDFVLQGTCFTLQLVNTGHFDIKGSGCLPDAPEAATYAIGAGSLLGNGLAQLVVGYCGTYGAPAVGGCVSLTCLQYHESGLIASPAFVGCRRDPTSKSWVPFCTLGLTVAVGVFGTDVGTPALGVAVIGCGATLQQLMQDTASVVGAIIPIDPATGHFPVTPTAAPCDLTAPPYNATVMCQVPASNPRHFALPSDVCGSSVVLGPPTLTTVDTASQILAYLQAVPYEADLSLGPPSLTFSTISTATQDCSVMTDQCWTFSQDAGTNLNLGPLSATAHMSSTYSENFSNMTDTSTTTSLAVTSTIFTDDMIIVYATAYQVWTYPVQQPATQAAADGSLAVIFPAAALASTTFTQANNNSFGYRPRNQPGLLISYPQSAAALTDYRSGLQLFPATGLGVGMGSGSVLTYDRSNINSDLESETVSVFNSLSGGAGAHFNANLFGYVPASFGLNVAEGETYSSSTTTTTSAAYGSQLSITFAPSALTDPDYMYTVYPYVYFDDIYGCLIVSYTIDLAPGGSAWTAYYAAPEVTCIRVFPTSPNPLRACFSRAIDFATGADGLDVCVDLFNASSSSASAVTCTLYAGRPTLLNDTPTLPTDARVLGSAALDVLVATGRNTVRVALPGSNPLAEGDCVTAAITWADGPTRLFWAVYPPSYFPLVRLD